MDFRGIIEFFRDALKYIVTAAIIFLLFIFVIGLQQVVGPSMSPTLKEGDVVVVNKLVYRFRDIKRNEIVVLSHDEKYMIKRVIGIPGDYVEYKNNILYINGQGYEESFIDKNVIHTDDFSLKDIGFNVIPEGKYFVVGDNRGDSLDSRSYGLVDKSKIIGKTMLRIWPLSKLNFF